MPGLPPSPAVRGEEGEGEAVEEGGVDSMLTALGLAADASADLALRRVHNMALVLQRLLEEEGGLHEAEPVLLSLEPGIRSRSEQVTTGDDHGKCVKYMSVGGQRGGGGKTGHWLRSPSISW